MRNKFKWGAGSSSFNVATGGADEKDLTLSVTGGGDSSLLLTSEGTGSDAALLTASSGGITLDGNANFKHFI